MAWQAAPGSPRGRTMQAAEKSPAAAAAASEVDRKVIPTQVRNNILDKVLLSSLSTPRGRRGTPKSSAAIAQAPRASPAPAVLPSHEGGCGDEARHDRAHRRRQSRAPARVSRDAHRLVAALGRDRHDGAQASCHMNICKLHTHLVSSHSKRQPHRACACRDRALTRVIVYMTNAGTSRGPWRAGWRAGRCWTPPG